MLGESRAPFKSTSEFDLEKMSSEFKIPVQSLLHADQVQLQALMAVAEAFKQIKLEVGNLDKTKVAVISASCLGLQSIVDFSDRVRHFEFRKDFDFLSEASLELIIQHKNKFKKTTEDTGYGVLNNVIAGRICNTFDFNGQNFNVDCDFNSSLVALELIFEKLQTQDGLFVLVFCDEKLNQTKSNLERATVHCLLVSSLDFAKLHSYPVKEIIEEINYYED